VQTGTDECILKYNLLSRDTMKGKMLGKATKKMKAPTNAK